MPKCRSYKLPESYKFPIYIPDEQRGYKQQCLEQHNKFRVGHLMSISLILICSFVKVPVNYLSGVVSLGQNIQQIGRGHKVEPGEGQTLGLQVLSQGLFTDGQPGARK